ncbi:MAG: hypothetical protein FWD42_04700, partial [Solirubrobacterales bacterium]|nr:hypothetical protein [Solirubrobacterales bacterium]
NGNGIGNGNGHAAEPLPAAGNGATVAAPARAPRVEEVAPRVWRAPAGTLARALPPEAMAGVALAGAGAALAAAVAIKASAAILLPVLLAALLRSPRRLAWFSAGLVVAGVALAVASYLAFGPHLPDLGTQGSLVTTMSVPNLIGLAFTLGGETTALHVLLTATLVILIAACCVSAWRSGDPITAGGWATIALVVTLSWVLPWYVLWVLPLAALSRSRRLRIATVALGAYLILAWMPVTSTMRAAIGFHPEKTKLGLFHQQEVKELMN